MKNFLLLVCLFITFISGCSKDNKGCAPVKPEAEESQIIAFAFANGIDSLKHENGIYYRIIEAGSGMKPLVNSTVSVTYTGKFLNGTVFEKSPTAIELRLMDVIEGWQIGLQMIKKGGRIKLIIPSAYAYGCNGKTGIPPNSVLCFDVSLINVK